MSIIKLNATDSTNLYLKELALARNLEDFTVVTAELQLNGRGQMGSVWNSDKGKNLTISILKKTTNFYVADRFNLNYIVSLAVYDVLSELRVPDLFIKWPNDILSGNQKICGILIENILKGNLIRSAILGIGVNVNQTNFGTLNKVSSLKLLLGKNMDLEALTVSILKKLKLYFKLAPNSLKQQYHEVLFRKDELSIFTNAEDEKFKGTIRSIDANGRLQVEIENKIVRSYNLKEIKLLY